jgi:preprotein translocase subunit SecA
MIAATRAIENAQRKVEARNFDIRKQLLEYDDVANDQRRVIYHQRNELLESSDVSDATQGLRERTIEDIVAQYIPPESVEEQWDTAGLEKALQAELNLNAPAAQWLAEDDKLDADGLKARAIEAANQQYAAKIAQADPQEWHNFERAIMLQSLDTHWREHLAALDHLRQGIHLRGYAQKNPKQEYKREAFELFEMLLATVRNEVTRILMTVQFRTEQELQKAEEPVHLENVRYQHADQDEALAEANADQKAQPVRAARKVGRNDPCPCGSGKKYKQCHGKLA